MEVKRLLLVWTHNSEILEKLVDEMLGYYTQYTRWHNIIHMIGNNVLETSIWRWSKKCGKIFEGQNIWQSLLKWGISLHIMCLDYNFITRSYGQCMNGTGHFPQRLKSVIMNTLSKQWNKEHIWYHRPYYSFIFLTTFGKVNI
jgi:hypothetical protein